MAKTNAAQTKTRGTISRPGKGAPRISGTAKAGARLGVEIDAGVAHVVAVAPDGVVTYNRVEAQSNALALAEVLKALGRSDNLRVALTSEHQSIQRLAIPNVPAHAVPMAIRSVAEEHMPMAQGGLAVAGLQMASADMSGGREMTVAAVSAADAAPLLRQLGSARPMTVSSFLLPADGLYLRVARSTAELVLIRDGAPVAVRALRSGGVAGLAQEMYQAPGTVFHGGSGNASIDAYIDDVVSDVRRTIVFWRREGTNVPDQLTIIGEGAALGSLEQRLREASYEIMPVPAPQGLNFDQVRIEDRPIAFQALAAALIDTNAQPFAALLDAAVTEPEKSTAHDPVPMIVAGVCAVLAVLLFGYGFYAKMQANDRLATANRELQTAQNRINALQPAVTLDQRVKNETKFTDALRKTEPYTATILRTLIDTAPDGTQFKEITTTKKGLAVGGSVKASVPNADAAAFRPIGAWQDAFLAMQKKAGGVTPNRDAWPGSVKRQADDPARADVDYAFSVDVMAFKTPEAGK